MVTSGQRFGRAEAATFLRQERDQILLKWESRIRSRNVAAAKQNQADLLNHLKEYLDQVVDILAVDDGSHPSNIAPVCEQHGHERADFCGYTLADVIDEYAVLRAAIFEVLEKQHRLNREARNLILDCIAGAMESAAEAFMSDRQAKEQKGRLLAEQESTRLLADLNLRDAFVASLSHDLRNPLGAVKMGIEILQNNYALPEDAHEVLELIAKTVVRAEMMLTDLLDVNRIRAGQKLFLNIQPSNMSKIVKGVLDSLKLSFGDRFVLREGASANGFWDAVKISRVIENLATNAAKYGEPNSPIVVTVDQNSDNTIVSVHNVGNPIPLREQTTLFDLYYRAGDSSSKPSGWGIGLSLVKGVAVAHGGKIEVQSSEQDGTTFSVILPNDARRITGDSMPRT